MSPKKNDFGVIISEDQKWKKQCNEAVREANRMLGMIKRNFIDSVCGMLASVNSVKIR